MTRETQKKETEREGVGFVIGMERVEGKWESKRERGGMRKRERQGGRCEGARRVPGKPMILKEGREDEH